MDITQPAVSQYITDKRGSELELSDDVKALIRNFTIDLYKGNNNLSSAHTPQGHRQKISSVGLKVSIQKSAMNNQKRVYQRRTWRCQSRFREGRDKQNRRIF